MPLSTAIHPRLISLCSAGYSEPCSTCNTSSERNSMALAMAWPCAGPSSSVRRISKSRVPCRSSIRCRSSLVDILGGNTALPVACQGERTFVNGILVEKGAVIAAPARGRSAQRHRGESALRKRPLLGRRPWRNRSARRARARQAADQLELARASLWLLRFRSIRPAGFDATGALWLAGALHPSHSPAAWRQDPAGSALSLSIRSSDHRR